MRLIRQIVHTQLFGIAGPVISFLSLPVLVRLLGPRDYGAFVLVQGALAIGQLIFSQNLFLYMRRQIPGMEKEAQYGYFKTLIAAISLLYILFICILYLTPLNSYISSRIGVDLPIMLLSLVLMFMQLLNSEWGHFYIAIQEIEINNIGVFVRTVSYSACIIISALFMPKFDLSFVLVLLIIAESVSMAYYAGRAELRILFQSQWKSDLISRGYWYALPLYPVALSSIAITYMDRYLLGMMESLEAVGQYGFAFNIVLMVSGFVGSSLTLTIFPYATEAQNKNDICERNRLLLMNIRYGVLLTLMFYVLLVVNREWVVGLIGGNQYGPAKSFLPILGLYPLLQVLISVPSHHLQLINKTKALAVMYPAFFLFNLGMSYYFIMRFGPSGAAFACVISLFIMSVVSMMVVNYYDGSLKIEMRSRQMLALGACCLILMFCSLSIDTLLPKGTVMLLINNALIIILSTVTIAYSGCLMPAERSLILSMHKLVARK